MTTRCKRRTSGDCREYVECGRLGFGAHAGVNWRWTNTGCTLFPQARRLGTQVLPMAFRHRFLSFTLVVSSLFGQRFITDGHVVAWPSFLRRKWFKSVPGWRGCAVSGEALTKLRPEGASRLWHRRRPEHDGGSGQRRMLFWLRTWMRRWPEESALPSAHQKESE